LRKIIKLKFEDCRVVKYLTTKIKHLFIRDKIYVFNNKNDVIRANVIKFQHKLLIAKHLEKLKTLEKIQTYYY